MSFHQGRILHSPYSPSFTTPNTSTYDFSNKAAIAAILLLLGCLTLRLFDAWPSTTQQFLWEGIVSLTPSRGLYSIEHAVMRYRNKVPDGARFRVEDFGNFQAKSDALQRIFHPDNNRFAATINRVRTLSGIGSMMKAPGRNLPSGLGNWDNSCYQNSIIQALASMLAFKAYLDQEVDTVKEEFSEASTHVALRSFTNKLSRNDDNGVLWTPPVLKSMNSWQQQDAQEFFSKMMDALEKEDVKSFEGNKAHGRGLELNGEKNLQEAKRSVRSNNSFEGLLAQRVVCRQCGFTEGLPLLPFNCLTVNMGREHEYTIADLLNEHTALEEIQGVECTKCTLLRAKLQWELLLSKANLSDQDEEPMHVAKVQEAAQESLWTIDEVFELDNFSESGVLKRCNIPAKNHVSSVKTKQVVVARPPKSLAIHINRSIFDGFGNQRKNTAIVRFPAVLDFGRWCLGGIQQTPGDKELEQWTSAATDSMLPPPASSALSSSTVAYELRAVVTHTGRHENGHYVAWAKRHSRTPDEGGSALDLKPTQERWYCFNDEIVTEISQADVLSCGHAFILFYEAVEVARETCRPETESISTSCKAKSHGSEITAEVVEPVNSEQGNEDLAVDSARHLEPVAEKPAPIEPAKVHVLEEGVGLVTEELPSVVSPRRPVAPIMRTSNEPGASPHGYRRKDNFSLSSASVVSAN